MFRRTDLLELPEGSDALELPTPTAVAGDDPMGQHLSVAWLSATDQLHLVRSRTASPEELRDAGVRRCERLDRRLGFLAAETYGRAPPGVPVLMKDAGQELAGTPHWVGLSSLRDAGHTSTQTTALAHRFERSGFSIVGKSACPPMANGVTTEPPGFPATRNPWDPTRSAGGSSGGAAAAVACGAVPIAHGSDATGSLRFPAALCGLVTLVPTAGTIEGVPPCGQPANHAWRDFVVARDARDLTLAFEVLARRLRPRSDRAPGRVGVLDHDPELGLTVDRACVRAVWRVAAVLELLRYSVEPGWPAALGSLWQRAGRALTVVADATRPPVLRWVAARLDRPLREGDVPAEAVEAAARDEARSDEEREMARSVIDEALPPILDWWHGWDLLVTPATFQPGWSLGGEPGLGECGTLAAPFSLTGQPSLVVPVHGCADGLPVGVQIVGRPGRDDDLLHLAIALQAHLGWTSHTPSTFTD